MQLLDRAVRPADTSPVQDLSRLVLLQRQLGEMHFAQIIRGTEPADGDVRLDPRHQHRPRPAGHPPATDRSTPRRAPGARRERRPAPAGRAGRREARPGAPPAVPPHPAQTPPRSSGGPSRGSIPPASPSARTRRVRNRTGSLSESLKVIHAPAGHPARKLAPRRSSCRTPPDHRSARSGTRARLRSAPGSPPGRHRRGAAAAERNSAHPMIRSLPPLEALPRRGPHPRTLSLPAASHLRHCIVTGLPNASPVNGIRIRRREPPATAEPVPPSPPCGPWLLPDRDGVLAADACRTWKARAGAEMVWTCRLGFGRCSLTRPPGGQSGRDRRQTRQTRPGRRRRRAEDHPEQASRPISPEVADVTAPCSP